MIARRIHLTFEFGEHPFDFTWQSLRYIDRSLRRSSFVRSFSTHFPRQRQSTDGDVTQAHHDGEERIQISEFFTTNRPREREMSVTTFVDRLTTKRVWWISSRVELVCPDSVSDRSLSLSNTGSRWIVAWTDRDSQWFSRIYIGRRLDREVRARESKTFTSKRIFLRIDLPDW